MPGPLEGIRVLDLTRGVAGPHATKLLADFGARVVKVEGPGGDPSRGWGPFKDDVPHIETSAPFLWINTSKRSVAADIESESGVEMVRRLLGWCDVVVEDFAPGALAKLGVDIEGERGRRPSLVACSITPFGQDGPFAQMHASDLVLQAMGGAMHQTGHIEREPLRLGGTFAEWHAGLVAAFAIVTTVIRAEAAGTGDHIDLSIYETQVAGKDRRQIRLLGYSYARISAQRTGTASAICTGVRPCADGYINLLGNGPRLPAVLRMIGREDLLGREEIRGPEADIPMDLVEEIEAAYLGWTMQHTMREALAIAQSHHILGGNVASIADVYHDELFRERGLWERIEHPVAGTFDYPGRPMLLSDSPRAAATHAPLLGEHTAEVLSELEAEAPRPRRSDAARHRGAPLEGLRVLDLTVVWAGPFGAQLLADWGAEVIRMEPLTALQPQTRGIEGSRHLTKEYVQRMAAMGSFVGAFPDRDPGADPWNRRVSFNSSSLGKRSFTGNMRTESGLETFRRLIEQTDIVIENNVPETMEKMQVTYDELRAINPAIIVVRMPGFGLTGERRNYRCWGNHLEGMTGHHLVRAYPDMSLDAAGESYACDSIAGLCGALGAVLAVRHRARTGRGQQVEVPQAEAFVQMMGVELLDYAMNNRVTGALGNDHRSRAPHNAYPCAPEADHESSVMNPDRWIAIDAGSDAEFAALCSVLSAEDLLADPRFASMSGRWEQRRALDAAIAERTRSRGRYELFEALQAAGVSSGPVQDEADVFRCAQLRHRGFYESVTRDDMGTFDYPGRIFRLLDTTPEPRRASPRLGEDNEHCPSDVARAQRRGHQALRNSEGKGTHPQWLLESV
ncbi:MAG: CoA transferase [Dehalococcoidia bacterium]